MHRRGWITILFVLTLVNVAAGQTKAPTGSNLKSDDIWHVSYIVWIRGTGGIGKDTQSSAWTIDRSYGGWLVLKSSPGYISPEAAQSVRNIPRGVRLPPDAIQALETAKRQLGRKQWIQVSDINNSNRRPIKVKINDEYEEVFDDRGGEAGVGKCRLSFKKTWTYDGSAYTKGTSILSYDPELKAAVMGFAINPYERADDLTPVKFTSDRISSGGSCGKSESSSKKIAFSDLEIPDIKGVVQNAGARLILPEKVLDLETETWEYTSPEFPTLHDMRGFEDSKGNVTGKIWLKFSRKPFGQQN